MNRLIARPRTRPLLLLCLLSAAPAAFAGNPKYSATAQERHDEMMHFFEEFTESTVPSSVETWWDYRYMLGNGAYRGELAKDGLTLSMKFVTDSVGNVSGGRDQGFTYTGSMGFDLEADLEKLLGLPGSEFYTSAVWRSGVSLSNRYIGNVFQTQQVYGGQNLRL